MRAVVALVIVVLLAGCGKPAPGEVGEDHRALLDDAMAALAGSRGPDGRWPAAQVPYVMEAAAAARLDVHSWPAPFPLADQVLWPAPDASFIASLRPLHAAALAAREDEPKLAEVRARVLAGFDGAQFGEPALVNDDAFALVVLGAAGADDGTWAQVDPAVSHLLEGQSADGGWSWSASGGQAETDMTGLVLHGLAQAGAIGRIDAERALAFLATTEVAGGGHALQAGGEANCDSTVWAIRAQAELGVTASAGTWRFLFALQDDPGGFAYRPGGPANALCTAEAATLLGLLVHGDVPVPAGLGEPAA